MTLRRHTVVLLGPALAALAVPRGFAAEPLFELELDSCRYGGSAVDDLDGDGQVEIAVAGDDAADDDAADDGADDDGDATLQAGSCECAQGGPGDVPWALAAPLPIAVGMLVSRRR